MKKLISVLLCFSVLAGCDEISEKQKEKKENAIITGERGEDLRVAEDKETGCQYFTNLNSWSSEGNIFKVRLRSDGQPMCPDVKAKDDMNDKQKNS